MAREFDKLVRDRIPEIIKDDGKEPVIHIADSDEYTTRLIEKLEEEVAEFYENQEVDELADILEVVHAIRKDRGLSIEELQDIREKKAEQRGRFDKGIVLERVEE